MKRIWNESVTRYEYPNVYDEENPYIVTVIETPDMWEAWYHKEGEGKAFFLLGCPKVQEKAKEYHYRIVTSDMFLAYCEHQMESIKYDDGYDDDLLK